MGVGEKKFKVCRKDVRKEKNIIIIEAGQNIKRYTIDFKIASTQHNTVQVYVPIKYGTLNVVLPLLHIRTPTKKTIKFNKNYISNAIPPTLTCI